MAHFAEVIDGVVVRVLVVEQEFIDTGKLGPKENWVQTSYNTRAGLHALGGTPLRKNYATAGMIYDSERDAFYNHQPFPSWTLNESTCQYEPPTPMPTDDDHQSPTSLTKKLYQWNESTTSWDERE